ncbi:hypothetical protein HMPREF9374_1257 [Desmospora sp. 8437]|nr:hypothetical protein HMPREF9374_1257 [Desmospora sp. 8437]
MPALICIPDRIRQESAHRAGLIPILLQTSATRGEPDVPHYTIDRLEDLIPLADSFCRDGSRLSPGNPDETEAYS